LSETCRVLYRNKFENSASCWLLLSEPKTVHIDALVWTLYMVMVMYVLNICINDR